MRNRLDEKKNKGQSAAELAIFGSIVIFVIGLILRSSLSTSYNANMDLRVFRMALRESLLTADRQYSQYFSAARNNANFVLLEDRLVVDPSSKHGTRDRAPYMAQGSGTFSHSLFMKTEITDTYDLPVYDFIINGQRFPFLTSRLVTKDLWQMYLNNEIPLCNADGFGPRTGVCYNGDAVAANINGLKLDTFIFFRKAYNGEQGSWCPDSAFCPKWPLNHRFDLNFDGAPEFNIAADVVPFKAGTASGAGSDDAFLRDTFMWQWVRVEQADLAKNMGVDVDGDRAEETVSSWEFDKNTNTARVTVLDLQEGDFNLTVDEGAKLYYTEWKAHQIATNPAFVDPGEIRTPGLERDLKMYSYTYGGSGASGDGTYLENREGKLYAANGQFVRNETSQDQLDIVERVLRLNNETGRFCSPNGNGEKGPCGASANCLPTDWSAEEWAKANGLFTMTNPVEACGQCFSSANHKLTCMDISGPTIFVRSRIRDRRRTRWITRTEERD